MKKKYAIVAILCPVLAAIDQITKYLVANGMHRGQTIVVVPGFLSWHYLVNPGASFGMFRTMAPAYRGIFFLFITLVAVAVLLYYLYTADDRKVAFPVFLACVISGAVGNLLDRLRIGHVVDFILVEFTFLGDNAVTKIERIFGTHYWPSFNVADMLIGAGIVGMAVDLIFFTDEKDETREIPFEDEVPSGPAVMELKLPSQESDDGEA